MIRSQNANILQLRLWCNHTNHFPPIAKFIVDLFKGKVTHAVSKQIKEKVSVQLLWNFTITLHFQPLYSTVSDDMLSFTNSWSQLKLL